MNFKSIPMVLLTLSAVMGSDSAMSLADSAVSSFVKSKTLRKTVNCENDFLSGRVITASELIRSPDAQYSDLVINNESSADVSIAILSDDRLVQYFTLLVGSAKSARINLPAGDFGILVKTGRSWCRDGLATNENRLNIDKGFFGERKFTFPLTVEMYPGEVSRFDIKTINGHGKKMTASSSRSMVFNGNEEVMDDKKEVFLISADD